MKDNTPLSTGIKIVHNQLSVNVDTKILQAIIIHKAGNANFHTKPKTTVNTVSTDIKTIATLSFIYFTP